MATPADVAVLRRAVEDIAGWRAMCDGGVPVLCHGDAHPLNVLVRGDETVVADWDDLCRGPAAWDHAPLMTWAERWGGHPNAYDEFSAGYGLDVRDSDLAKVIAQVRLLGPTLAMIIRGATSPTGAAEARRRLRYWHYDPNAPPWTPL